MVLRRSSNYTLAAKDPKQRGLEEPLGVYRLRFNVTLRISFESESFKPWFTLFGSTLWDSTFSGSDFGYGGRHLWSTLWGIHSEDLLSRATDFDSEGSH